LIGSKLPIDGTEVTPGFCLIDLGGKLNSLENNKDYQSVVLAALLHDVGKFYRRSSNVRREVFEASTELELQLSKHPIFSSWFVKNKLSSILKNIGISSPLVETLTQHHHESTQSFPPECLVSSVEDERIRILALIVSRADTYSARERLGEQPSLKAQTANALDSIFSTVRVEENDETDRSVSKNKHQYIFPSKLSGEAVLPVRTAELYDLQGKYDNLVSSFGQAIAPLQADDFKTLYTQLLSLLYLYLWSVPSDQREEIKDLSLYDHLKTTSAIAACLYLYHKNSDSFTYKAIDDERAEKFLLVGGDLSGIQDYLYQISEIGAGGVAKRLRARSLRLTLLTEATCHLILDQFNLPMSCQLWSAGGRFCLLLPADSLTRSMLQQIKISIAQWIYKEYLGNLAININWKSISPSSLKVGNFANELEELNLLLENSKKSKFSTILFAQQPQQYLKESPTNEWCKICSKEVAKIKEEGREICSTCAADKEAGSKLPNAKFISFSNKRNNTTIWSFFDKIFVGFHSSAEECLNLDSSLIYSLFPKSAGELVKAKPCIVKLLANYVPPLTFAQLAEKSDGFPLLGVLKADVDHLGFIFSSGLGANTTISRFSTLSSMLDVFFSCYVTEQQMENFKHIYTVYSGGDDLLLVGPWTEILSFSRRLQEDFKRFAANNPQVTISAGVVLDHPKVPIWDLAERADRLLEKSKEEGRNRITVFDVTVPWSEFADLTDNWARPLDEYHRSNQVSASFIYQFLTYRKLLSKRDLTYKAKLAYNIARNINMDEVSEKFKSLTTSEGERVLKNISYPVRYALLRSRKSEKKRKE
jgi:CRISPR-associated protein Csm1